MPDFPLPTLAAEVTAEGISAPSYNDIYSSLIASFQSIYGSDAYLAPDSQDGQLLAVFARAIHDCNQAAIAVYNSFSPATAFGEGLSRVVRINGIQRRVATFSQADVLVVGVVGTEIINGIVRDASGNRWNLPALVVIPPAGEITVTATAQQVGDIQAPANTINQIETPTLGWQTVTNPLPATQGLPVESDAALRRRQLASVALASQTVLAGIVGAVQSVQGVGAVRAYENDTDAVDTNGLPAKSIALIVEGGDNTEIATAIMNKKAPGVFLFGTTTVELEDAVGITQTIRFSRPSPVRILVEVTIDPFTGYTATVGNKIKQSVADYINLLGVGRNVILTRLFAPALLPGDPDARFFEIDSIQISAHPAAVGSSDVAIAFNELATCDPDDVTITLL